MTSTLLFPIQHIVLLGKKQTVSPEDHNGKYMSLISSRYLQLRINGKHFQSVYGCKYENSGVR